MRLALFTRPEILQQIGHLRLPMFFRAFAEDLKAANVLLPAPPDPDDLRIPDPAPDSPQGIYFASMAAILSSPALLPERLRAILFTLEEAASPENDARLQDAFQRRIPCLAVSPCALDRALDLWFAAPEELSQFAPPAAPKSDEGEPAASGTRQQSALNQHAPNRRPSTINNQLLTISQIEPWSEPVNGKLLLDALVVLLKRFVVLPRWAAETLALWILHTFAFQLRDVTTYIGIESPEPQCGKTTLLTVLNGLAYRALAASNISPPTFFRVIEDMCPTLLIDEADTFLHRNDQLQGILNSGYSRQTAFVLRVGPSGPAPDGEEEPENCPGAGVVNRFSCWCPKVISQIGRLPGTLADRCILIRMQRKTPNERCDRLRNLDALSLQRQCARFVRDHAHEIATARPLLPPSLSDRAADIWEPLLALADLAGAEWSERARQAAVGLAAAAQENNPIGSLLLDIFITFTVQDVERIFSRTLVDALSKLGDRPWMELRNGKPITDRWLSQQLRAYGIRPKTIWLGNMAAKGYLKEDFMDAFRRYIPHSELDALTPPKPPEGQTGGKDAAGSVP